MKIIKYLSVLFLFLPIFSFSQKKLTIEDASGMNRATLSHLPCGTCNGWAPATGSPTSKIMLFLSERRQAIVSDTLLRYREFNEMMKTSGFDTLPKMPSIKWLDESSFTFTGKNNVYLLNLKNNSVSLVNTYPEEAENIDSNPDGKLIAYTVKNNLFIASSGKQVQVTNDENTGIVNGQIVSRNEFGINKGTFWSPSGKLPGLLQEG